MTFAYIAPLAAGNAVSIKLNAPDGTQFLRVLRKVSTDGAKFDSELDTAAVVVFEGTADEFIDTECLINGTTYLYGDFTYDGVAWSAGDTATATPAATYEDQSVDVMTFVRERISLGLANEIAQKRLFPETKVIEVLTAPPLFDRTRWPVVTVHLSSDGSAERGIGEEVSPDIYSAVGSDWTDLRGWLSHTSITVIGWSKNPDERIALRMALRRIVIANLQVFDSAAIQRIDFRQTDEDIMSGLPVPVYQSIGTFTCFAPVAVGAQAGGISGVTMTFTPSN